MIPKAYLQPHLTVYVVGAISSCLDTYKENFRKAVEEVKEAGYARIIDPSVLPGNLSDSAYAVMSQGFVNACDILYVQNNWAQSDGTKSEIAYAKWLGKDIYWQD